MGKKILSLVLVLWLTFCAKSAVCDIFSQQNENRTNIRVAISSNDFSTTKYKEVVIGATQDWQIYDEDSRQIVAFAKPDKNLKIVLKAGMFDIYDNNIPVCSMLSGPLKITTKPDGYLKIENLTRKGKEALFRGYFFSIKGLY